MSGVLILLIRFAQNKMAKTCAICNKGSLMFGKLNKLRGKYNPAPKVRKYPNLQWLTVPKDVRHKSFTKLAGQRIEACAKCIKTLSKPARQKKQKEAPAIS